MQILGPKRLNRALGRNLADKGGATDLFSSAPLDLRFALLKTLDPRVTFTRASSATYVGSDGLIKSAVTNLVLRSEEFDNASWTKNNVQAFGSGSVANATIAPNGTLTADKIVENTATAQHMVYQNTTPEIGKAYVLTFYAKAAERIFVTAAFSGGGLPSDCRFGVNLSTGEIVSGSTSGSPELTQVTPIGDGWYRIALIKTIPAASGLQPRILMSTNGTTQSYLGDGTSGLYLWGAQLEQSATVGEYIPTTSTINSAPRFDHNPTTGESLGLLVEEARTNLLLRSEEFDNASWIKAASSVSANAIASPFGTTTADKLIEDSTLAQHYDWQLISVTAGTSYTISSYVKAAERSEVYLSLSTFNSAFLSDTDSYFNLSSGTIRATGPNATARISSAGNGWYRCSVSGTAQTTTFAIINAAATSNGTTFFYTGNGTSGIYVWGAQLEAGAFPTSYIPTTTATVTRAADVASITGTNFSSWYNQTEGTVFADAKVPTVPPATSLASVFALSDGTTSNRIAVYKRANADTSARLDVAVGGTSSAFINAGTFGFSNLTASCYRLNDFAVSLNGLTPVTDTLGPVPSVSRINIGSYADATFQLNGTIKRLTYWPTRLATLQAISQP